MHSHEINHQIDHEAALYISSSLTESFYQMRQKEPLVTPTKVIAILNSESIKFVLMGVHGIGDWTRDPRATRDVDVLIAAEHHEAAVSAIRQVYPKLLVQEHDVVTRFLHPDDGYSLIDLMKPVDKLYKIAFENTIRVGESYNIPDLEMALTCKYAAMISPHRPMHKKHMDASDFIQIVKCNLASLQLEKVRELGDFVFDGGGNDLLKLVEDVSEGRPIRI